MPNILLLFVITLLLISSATICSSIKWETCRANSNKESTIDSIFRKDVSLFAECTSIDVPLIWNAKTDTRSRRKFYVKRFLSKDPRARKGVIWLLEGGPGLDGTRFETLADAIRQELNDNYDVYIYNYRGTGSADALTCSGYTLYTNNPSTIAKCLESLKAQFSDSGLAAFGTTNAAYDIGHAINMTKAKNDKVIVYGVSYGTYLMNRLLLLFPNLVDMAIADSVMPADANFQFKDDQFAQTGLDFMNLCESDRFCSAKFPAGVINTFDTVFAKQSGPTPCMKSISYTPKELPSLLAKYLGHKDLRKFIFPMIYRLNRCSEEDKQWLSNLDFATTNGYIRVPQRDTMIANAAATNGRYNYILMMLVVLQEFIPKSRSTDSKYWEQRYASFPPYFHANVSSFVTQVAEVAKLSIDDRYKGRYATSYRNPMLVLHGTLDANSPNSSVTAWLDNFTQDHIYVATFPNAVHGLLTRTELIFSPERHCGIQIMVNFINNPSRAPDMSCIKEYMDYKISFNTTLASVQYEGTYHDNLWEGGPIITYSAIRRRFIVMVSIACGTLVALVAGGIAFAAFTLFLSWREKIFVHKSVQYSLRNVQNDIVDNVEQIDGYLAMPSEDLTL